MDGCGSDAAAQSIDRFDSKHWLSTHKGGRGAGTTHAFSPHSIDSQAAFRKSGSGAWAGRCLLDFAIGMHGQQAASLRSPPSACFVVLSRLIDRSINPNPSIDHHLAH